MASSKKQYGLILPGKKFNIDDVKRPSVFNVDSDSDEEAKEMGANDWIKKSYQKQAAQSAGIRKQTEIDIKKALDEDPTVYKYDEIYEDIEKQKREEEKKNKDDKKKPRYIQSLLKKAELRKIENERRVERQVQKEREAEGEQFKDKETFVTSSYKKKLEEFSKLDEEERRQDMLEEICDVSKQKDLGGFYRHLYRSTVDKTTSDKPPQDETKPVKEEPLTEDKKVNKERQYRKRVSSESSIEEGERGSDSDTTISSSSSESSSSKDQKSKNLTSEEKDAVPKKRKKSEDDENKEFVKKKVEEKDDPKQIINSPDKKEDKENLPVEETKIIKKEEPRINIWIKRTVGPVFEAALQRYYERKATLQAMS